MESESSSLAKNSIFNVAHKVLNTIFPLITSIYVSHILLADGIGSVSKAQNIVSYFTLIAALGLPNYGTREIAKVREDNEKTNQLFTELFLINLCSTIFCTITYLILICNVTSFHENIGLYIVVGLPIIFNAINIEWFYQGFEKYQYIAIRSFVVKIICLVLVFCFVRSRQDIVKYGFIVSLGTCGNYILNIISLRDFNLRFNFKNFNPFRHLKPVFILLVTTVSIELYTLLDTTMLGIFCEDENVGYYTNIIKMVKVVITVITAIGGTLLPRLSYYSSKGDLEKAGDIVNKVFLIMLFLFVPCTIGFFVCSDLIVPVLFGSSFMPAVQTLKIASFLVLALGFSNLFGTQILLTFNEERKLLICTAIGAVINITLNAFLIPRFMQDGAAFASVISEAMVTLLTYNFARKFIKIRVNWKNIFDILFASVIMTIILYLIKINLNAGMIVKLVICVVIGVATYFGVNFILKDSVIQELLRLVNKEK